MITYYIKTKKKIDFISFFKDKYRRRRIRNNNNHLLFIKFTFFGCSSIDVYFKLLFQIITAHIIK
jgi:hypothetical protein